MVIVIIDCKLEDYVCTRFLKKEQFKEWLSEMNEEIYFVNVTNITWDKFKTKKSVRLELKPKELNELLEKASYVFIIGTIYVGSCMYYPKDNDQ